MKILHSADWHLDTPQPDLRKDLLSIPGKIADLARREKCDLMLLSGDLFDGKATPVTIKAVQRALEEVRIARQRGLTVYVETCPHYLLLDDKVQKALKAAEEGNEERNDHGTDHSADNG